jgi:23S rRNA maturation mini-RNase III
MSKREDEFNYISEDDYKTLISVYQQKTFKLFNENISLEAKVATLNSLVEKLTDNVNKITKTAERNSNSKRKTKSPQAQDDFVDETLEEETFN